MLLSINGILNYLRQRKLKRYRFIDQEKVNYPIKMLCWVMEVSPSGYYAWRKRLTRTAVCPPKISKTIGQRLLLGKSKTRWFAENQSRFTNSKGTKASPNLLANVELERCAAEKIIIGDIIYLPMKNGKFCYLAVWHGQNNEKNNRLECGGNDDR